jgi:acetolactate synthase-1/2/3 large subunit
MIRLADYVMRTLVQHGVTDCFIVTGGGAMHLNDAVGRCEGMRWLPNHHEQACAMAAQGYARMLNKPALVQVTTGPGGTNALTGVFGAFVDSLPMIVVSGQVKRETMMSSYDLPLRQLGDQEVDIIAMARPVTKYAACVTDPSTIRYHLERAIHEASAGRPGPVWIDIPVDVQAAMVDENSMKGFTPGQVDPAPLEGEPLTAAITDVAARLARAERPVIYAGAGVRLSGAAADFMKMVERLGVPVVTGFNAHDLIASDHPLFAGRPGTIGDRPGNFAVQNSDCVLVLGCRLNIRQISYAWQNFARAAELIVVDVDAAELAKPTIKPTVALHAHSRVGRRNTEASGLGCLVCGAQGEVSRGARRILAPRERREPVLLWRRALESARGKRRDRHRRWHRMHRDVPVGETPRRPAALLRFRLRADGLRSSGRDRRVRRA